MNDTAANPYGTASMADPANLAGTVLCAVSFFACFFSAFWIVVNRDLKSVYNSQPAGMFLALFSLALLDGSILLGLGRPMNPALCVGRMWGAQLAMFAFLMSQLMKGWVLFRYTQSSRKAVFKAAEDKALIASLVLLFIFSIILLLWTILEPVKPTATGDACISNGQAGEIASLTCLSVMWCLWFFFCSQTYELRTRFTNRQHVTCFFTGLAGVMAFISAHSFPEVFTAEVRFVTEASCSALVSFLVIGLGVLPKVFMDSESLEEDDTLEKVYGKSRRRGTTASTMTRNTSSRSLVSHDGRGSVYSNRSSRHHGSQSSHRSTRSSRHSSLSEFRSSSAMRRNNSQLSVYQLQHQAPPPPPPPPPPPQPQPLSPPPFPQAQTQAQAPPPRRRTVRYEDEEKASEPQQTPQQQYRVMTVFNPPPSFNEMGIWL